MDGHAETWWGGLIDSRSAQVKLFEFAEAAVDTELAKYLLEGMQRPDVHYTSTPTDTEKSPVQPARRAGTVAGLRKHGCRGRGGAARTASEAQSKLLVRLRIQQDFCSQEWHPIASLLARRVAPVFDRTPKISRGALTFGGMVMAAVGDASSMWTTQEFLTITELALVRTQVLEFFNAQSHLSAL